MIIIELDPGRWASFGQLVIDLRMLSTAWFVSTVADVRQNGLLKCFVENYEELATFQEFMCNDFYATV